MVRWCVAHGITDFIGFYPDSYHIFTIRFQVWGHIDCDGMPVRNQRGDLIVNPHFSPGVQGFQYQGGPLKFTDGNFFTQIKIFFFLPNTPMNRRQINFFPPLIIETVCLPTVNRRFFFKIFIQNHRRVIRPILSLNRNVIENK